ncbi:hypothetical protein ACTXGJ_00510 [Psychrobacter sp. 1Y11]|uniref:hypothetical protein n=1 Tax=Psychrobacter sp. 1Y11 TaxID=3457446 RepID=UPI003FD6BD31
MTNMTNKSGTLKTTLLSAASSSFALMLGLTGISTVQAAVSLDEDVVISPTAVNCHIGATKLQNNYKGNRQRAIACMQLQLKSYQLASMSARQQYFAYKAQAWLNYTNHEDSINSSTAAGDYAFDEAKNILQALQSGREDSLNLMVDIPKTSALMRPDIWANISALKDSGGIASAPRELAFSEVSLVWAAADHCEHGSRSSGSHFRMADRWLEQAREAFVNANDSAASLAMQELAVSYYQQYKTLNASDDVCRGQELTSLVLTAISLFIADSAITHNIKIASAIPSTEPTVSYQVIN